MTESNTDRSTDAQNYEQRVLPKRAKPGMAIITTLHAVFILALVFLSSLTVVEATLFAGLLFSITILILVLGSVVVGPYTYRSSEKCSAGTGIGGENGGSNDG